MSKHTNSSIFIMLMAIPAFIWLVPILWMLSLSFQPNTLLQLTTTDTAFGLIPAQFTLDNYGAVLTLSHTPRWFLNSIVVAAMTTIGVVLVAAPAGYAFARMNFPLKTPLLVLCLMGMAIPEQAIFIPLYTMFADLGWHNSYHGLAIPRIATPVGVFLMYQFMRGVPRDIEENRNDRRGRPLSNFLKHCPAFDTARANNTCDLDVPLCVERLSVATCVQPEDCQLHNLSRDRLDPDQLCPIRRIGAAHGFGCLRITTSNSLLSRIPEICRSGHRARRLQGLNISP